MKISFKYKKIDSSDFIKKYNRMRRKILLYTYNKKALKCIIKGMETNKALINLLHNDLKEIYNTITQINTIEYEFLFKIRGILMCTGNQMSPTNFSLLKSLVYDLINSINNIHKKEFLKEIKYKEFLDKAISIINVYEKMLKLDFKIRNREIILNNIKF